MAETRLENEDSSEVPAVNGSHQEDIQSTEEPPEDISDDVTEQGPAEDDQDAPQTIEEPEPVEPETSLPAPTQNGTANTSVPAKPPERHVRTRHHGPSMLEQVVSQTRPAHLPPKQKMEDLKHMADWQVLMQQSRSASERRKKSVDEARLLREIAIEQRIPQWDKEVLPDWKAVFREPALRKLWWNGIPAKMRGQLWASSIGNALALGKVMSGDSYRNCLSRANRAISSGQFPSKTLASIDDDIMNTLPALKLFLPGVGPMHDDLRNLLIAWMVSRTDEGSGFYVSGVARIAAMLLINMSTNEQAFVALRNYLERGCPRALYGGEGSREDLEAYFRIFDTLLADYMPKIYFNFKQHQISPAIYLPQWLIPGFLDHLPFEACARVWDVLVLEGDSFLYRIAIAILGVIESRLFFPDKQELVTVLQGEHRAAMEVALRSGVDISNGKYSIYGLDDQSLWARLDEIEGWWKDSTWNRLLQRELPDI